MKVYVKSTQPHPPKHRSFWGYQYVVFNSVTHDISRNIFDFTQLVTHLMQSKNNDIMNGMHLIEEIENIWLRIRNETDLHHDCWYSYQTVTLSAKADVNECML